MIDRLTKRRVTVEVSGNSAYVIVPNSQSADLSSKLLKLRFSHEVNSRSAAEGEGADDTLNFGNDLSDSEVQALQEAIDDID